MKHTLPHRLIFALTMVLMAALATALPSATRAQNLFAPVARVNDSVITAYELSQRIAFLTLLNAPGDIRKVATDQLIEERLKMAVARQMGIELSPEQLQAGMNEFAARANLDAEKFIAAIAQGGVAAESFRDFVAAGMIWREVVRARFIARVNISEAEIDRAAAMVQPGGGVRVLLSEIILPANSPAARQASSERAAQLAQITTLPAFAAAARNYSVAPSRGRGGRLDWVALSDLPPAVAGQVLALSPGQVTAPIPVRGGIALFQMRAIKETEAAAATDVSLDFAQYYLAGGRSPATLAEAAKITDRVDTCDDLYGVAKGQPEEVLEREVLPVGEVPTDIALELAKLDDGEVSLALTRNNGETLVFLMLCGRTNALAEEVSRSEIRDRLRNQRLAALADSYLQELRADAFIEMYQP